MEDSIKDVCYGSGMIDGLLLAQRITVNAGGSTKALDAMISILLRARSFQMMDLMKEPSDAVAQSLLDLREM